MVFLPILAEIFVKQGVSKWLWLFEGFALGPSCVRTQGRRSIQTEHAFLHVIISRFFPQVDQQYPPAQFR